MLCRTIKTTPVGIPTNYTDALNNTRIVTQSVLVNNVETAELEESIVEELVRIFTHNIG